MTPGAIACPICGTAMRVTVTTNRNGKHAIGVHCPDDGRHFRGFINHKPYVEAVLGEAVAEAGARPDVIGPGGGLQNGSGGPAGRLAPS
ncbi:MAG TPA: hypothetical protein VNN74_06725 [Candidatus Micrarchaeia archaeon]|nr:hypothetical protein [Candidatus Micrarchaeia archaeon]